MCGVLVFKIFPCDQNKQPLISNWQQAASDDPIKHKEWAELFRDRLALWGVPTGRSNGILALDIDNKKGKNGFDSLKRLGLECHATLSQRTISNGMHLLYQYPQDGKHYGNRAGLIESGSGLDIRGEGGYVCLYNLDTNPITPAPEWLVKEAGRNITITGEQAGASASVAAHILQKSIDTIHNAPEGERNNTLNTEAFKVLQLVASGSIDKNIAFTLLEAAALKIGLTPHEIHATLNSALRGGEAKPLTSPFSQPIATIDIPAIPVVEKWTPPYLTFTDLTNVQHLRRPQLFKDWSTEDIHLTTADGGTGKTTLKLFEAVCLALGERFLGFENVQRGKTLFITGEDSREKLAAMLGKIMSEMGIMGDSDKVNTVLNSIVIKKDSDLCLVVKDRQNFLIPNEAALAQVLEAVREIKPKLIVLDPIASFWGSEAALNDMAKAVSKFTSRLVHEGNCCVEMINHMGKVSSSSKDMTQFAGRGGTGLPSHARVSRVMREVSSEEYLELTNKLLSPDESCIMVNVNKFSDGSPIYNKPFLVIRKGYLFHKEELPNQVTREEDKKVFDAERVFNYIKDCSLARTYPTRAQVIAYFSALNDKLSKQRVDNAINLITFTGYKGVKVNEAMSDDATIAKPVLSVDV